MSGELLGPLPVPGGPLGQRACTVLLAEDRVGVGSPQARWARRRQVGVDRTLPWHPGSAVLGAPVHPHGSLCYYGPAAFCLSASEGRDRAARGLRVWLHSLGSFQVRVCHAYIGAASLSRRSPCMCTVRLPGTSSWGTWLPLLGNAECVHTPVMALLAQCSWHWPPRQPCALEAVLLDRFPVARRQGASETICWDRNLAGRW